MSHGFTDHRVDMWSVRCCPSLAIRCWSFHQSAMDTCQQIGCSAARHCGRLAGDLVTLRTATSMTLNVHHAVNSVLCIELVRPRVLTVSSSAADNWISVTADRTYFTASIILTDNGFSHAVDISLWRLFQLSCVKRPAFTFASLWNVRAYTTAIYTVYGHSVSVNVVGISVMTGVALNQLRESEKTHAPMARNESIVTP